MFDKISFLKLAKAAGCKTEQDLQDFTKGFIEKTAGYESVLAEEFIKGIGSGIGRTASSGMFKGTEALVRGSTGQKLSTRQKRFIEDLIKSDHVLRGRKPEIIVSHYQTLAKLAPSIAMDRNAVSSFLRQSTQYEGIDPTMLRTLADLEGKVVQNIKGQSWF